MPFSVELSEEETECLQRYFERVDETEDFSFHHPTEPLAFRSLIGQLSTEALQTDAPGGIARLRRVIARMAGRGVFARGPARNAAREAPSNAQSPSVSASMRARAARGIVHDCIRAFASNDRAALVAIFVRDAHVVTPFHGRKTVPDFLQAVLAAPGGARLTCHALRRNIEGRPQALGYFIHESWSAQDASQAGVFNCVLNISAQVDGIQSMIVF